VSANAGSERYRAGSRQAGCAQSRHLRALTDHSREAARRPPKSPMSRRRAKRIAVSAPAQLKSHHGRMARSRRSHNRITDNLLTDDSGNQWHRVRSDVPRAAVVRLLADRTVRVGVHCERRMLRWISDADRERVWREEIEPKFHDCPDDATVTPTSGQLAFHGTLWRRRGNQMLVFDDFD
jgi:hypothetical protein